MERGPLKGIARLAAESEMLEAKRRVSYFELPARSFITRCSSARMPFRWTINPYRGCEFGCKYCYARYTHEFMELRDGRDFEEKIFAKLWNAVEFRRELARIDRQEAIAIGTATDPYQPAERRFRVTQAMLRVFEREGGRRLSITTKSDLVARDAALLARIARANVLHINVTVTTLDAKLAREMEPYAPRPSLRLEAVARLAERGLHVGVFAMPVLPLLNDRESSLDAVAAAAAASGARYFGGRVVFLKPCAQQVFFPWLERAYPQLVRKYRERFEHSAFLDGEYPRVVAARIDGARRRHGLAATGEEYQPELWEGEPQLELFTLR